MTQLALISGAEVVASVCRPELHDRVRSLGAVTTVTPDDEAGHGPFDIIVELVGGADCLRRIGLLRTGGRYVIVGVQGGTTAPLPMFELMLRRATIIGTTIRGRDHVENDTAYGRLAEPGKFGKIVLVTSGFTQPSEGVSGHL